MDSDKVLAAAVLEVRMDRRHGSFTHVLASAAELRRSKIRLICFHMFFERICLQAPFLRQMLLELAFFSLLSFMPAALQAAARQL
jgi:hypothetical protein